MEFDHERLDVYRFALEFYGFVGELAPRRGGHVVRDQLERASLSIVLCIAEGGGRRAPQDKRRFYTMARGSATESAAILDALRLRRVIAPDSYTQGRSQLLSIVRMLSRLTLPPDAPSGSKSESESESESESAPGT